MKTPTELASLHTKRFVIGILILATLVSAASLYLVKHKLDNPYNAFLSHSEITNQTLNH